MFFSWIAKILSPLFKNHGHLNNTNDSSSTIERWKMFQDNA
jgi:hypothetical protein